MSDAQSSKKKIEMLNCNEIYHFTNCSSIIVSSFQINLLLTIRVRRVTI